MVLATANAAGKRLVGILFAQNTWKWRLTAMANEKNRSADEKEPLANDSDAPPRFIHFEEEAPPESRGLGPEAGGQSGDTTGLSQADLSGPESVEGLREEGHAF